MSKKMTRREMLKLSGLVAAGSFLAACGGGKGDEYIVDQAALENATGNVTVMHFLHEFTEDHVAGFQAENPSITVEVADASDATRFYAMLAAGTPPDLYRTMAPDIPQFLARNLIMNLQGFFDVSDAIQMDDLAPANDNYKANGPFEVGKGPIYGMCKDFSPDQTIFINTKMFEEAGIPVPTDDTSMSYADVQDYARKMTKFDGERLVSYGYGYETGWIGRMVQNMIIEKNVDLYSKDFEQTLITDSEQATAAFKYYYDHSIEKTTHSTINPSPTGWFGNDFTAGTLGMIQYGYWYSAMAESDENRGYVQMMPAANWAGKHRDPCVTATGMVMLKASQAPEAAWKVFEYYNAGAPAVERSSSGWGVPALKSLYPNMPQETDFQKQAFKVVMGEIALNDAPLQFNPYLTNDSWPAVWNVNLDLALTGAITFDEMLTNIEDEINLAISEGKERVDSAV
ncbi:MAG: extracellular solute-binding protein [Anaerolineaceae bacterium]|nr:extracellular solute-binding protein [Anaerolineaceae bacterium]